MCGYTIVLDCRRSFLYIQSTCNSMEVLHSLYILQCVTVYTACFICKLYSVYKPCVYFASYIYTVHILTPACIVCLICGQYVCIYVVSLVYLTEVLKTIRKLDTIFACTDAYLPQYVQTRLFSYTVNVYCHLLTTWQ
jgi:hypothetical protein